MPGLPPLSSVGETRWGGAPPRSLSDDRWRSFQLGGHGRSSAAVLLGTTTVVDSTPVEDLNFSRQLGMKKKMESFFQNKSTAVIRVPADLRRIRVVMMRIQIWR